MLRQKIQTFEYLIAIFFLLQTFLPSYFNISTTLICFAILLFAKSQFEGIRTTIILILLIQLIFLITSITLIRIPLIALLCLAIQYFPVYRYPEPMGKYKVGYKRLVLPGITNIGVYYPTNQQTKDVRHFPYHQAWERITTFWNFSAEHFKEPTIPPLFFKMAFNFLEHQGLGVNLDAKIAREANDKFPPVIFSHGLSANIHIYSLHLKEWASQGFIVLSVDHDEELKIDSRRFANYPELLKIRASQLNDRKEIIKRVIDLISKPDNIHELFQDDTITLDLDNLFVAGHSFGGITAAELAIEESRVTGGILILDPWFEPAHLDFVYTPINKPLLSIRSHAYEKLDNLGPPSRKHAKANSENGMCLSGYFDGSFHNSCTDLPLLLPRELMLFGVIKTMDDLGEQVKYQTSLTRDFLQVAVENNRDRNENDKYGLSFKNKVLKRFRNDIKELGVPDLLCVDDS